MWSRQLAARYDDGFRHGFRSASISLAMQVLHDAVRAKTTTDAGRSWADDLARLGERSAVAAVRSTSVPPQADHYRTPASKLHAATRLETVDHARLTAWTIGVADGRVAAVALSTRDIYCAAKEGLGDRPGLPARPGLRPLVDGLPAHRWLERARLRWQDVVLLGPEPLPGTAAAAAYSTLTGGVPIRLPADPPANVATDAHRAARPAPGLASGGRRAAGPPPAGGPATPRPVPRQPPPAQR